MSSSILLSPATAQRRASCGGADPDRGRASLGSAHWVSSRVPFEYLGRGRCFREKLAVADDRATGTMISIFTSLARRADRSPIPRCELLTGAERRWLREMPAFGLLDSKIIRSGRNLQIREVRSGVGTVPVGQEGEDREAVIAIVSVELLVAKGICQLATRTTALISLHALARWYQRSFDNGETTLWSDLRSLAAKTASILESRSTLNSQRFSCRVSSGEWVGSFSERPGEITGHPEQVLNVRTFIAK